MTVKTRVRLRLASLGVFLFTVAASIYAAGIKTLPIKYGTSELPLWGLVGILGGLISLIMLLVSSNRIMELLANLNPWRPK